MKELSRFTELLDSEISEANLRKILLALVTEDLPWNTFARARVPFGETISVLRALQRGGWLKAPSRSLELTATGAALASELGVERLSDYVCTECNGSGMSGIQNQDFFLQFIDIFNRRPSGENSDFDQSSMTPLSLSRRLSWMIHHGDVTNRRVIVLGDDDYMSIALALTRLPAQVTILEIDPRICEFIEMVSSQEQLEIQVIYQDLCKFLPANMHGGFDTFVCDPPESEKGMLLFLEKGLSLLAPGDSRAGYFGVTTLESTTEKWARWQKHLLNRYKLALTAILPPFTEYLNWDGQKAIADVDSLATLAAHPWYRSWLYRIETTRNFTPPADFEIPLADAFAVDNEGYYHSWGDI